MKVQNASTVEAWKAGNTPPPGSYIARIDEADEGKSRGGYDQFTLRWTVVGGQFDGAEITEWLVVSQPQDPQSVGMKKLVALIDAVGIDRNVDEFELTEEMLVGKLAKIVCVAEPGQNDPSKTFTKVAGHKPAPEGAASNGQAPARGDLDDNGKPLPF